VQWGWRYSVVPRVADGNESDSAIFAKLLADFKQQWQIDALFVADAALYTQGNLQQMQDLRWVSRVPATPHLPNYIRKMSEDAFGIVRCQDIGSDHVVAIMATYNSVDS